MTWILTHLLEGCRYAGNLALGRKLFTEMVAGGVKPSEFTLLAMLKLCGHVGAHQEAHDLVAGWEVAHGHKPSVIHFTCLMSGCLRRKHYDLAREALAMPARHKIPPETLNSALAQMQAAEGYGR